MSMQQIICPHCKRDTGTMAVNDGIKMSVCHKVCPHCRGRFTWQGIYGTVKVVKK